METELEQLGSSTESIFDSYIDGFPSSSSTRRSICANCNRPSTVCICSVLPKTLIQTSTKIIVIQHPHQLQNPLCTVPILTKSLLNATVIVTRRLRLGTSPILDSLYYYNSEPSAVPKKAVYLFPPTKSHQSSTPLSALRQSVQSPIEILIAFDGTWSHAKEMVAASADFLSRFAERVCLECDESVEGKGIYDSELILRKEPYLGCVSTAEAVARVLSVIEPNAIGIMAERQVVGALEQMVKLQKGFLKPNVTHRPKLKKKTKKGEIHREVDSIQTSADVLSLGSARRHG